MEQIRHGRGISAAWRRSSVSLLALVLVGLAAGSTFGAGSVSLALSPSRVVFSAQPGATVAAPITVYNQGSAPLDLTVTVGDFLLDDGTDAASTFGVDDWVRTNVSSLRVEPQAQAEIRVIVDVPMGAAPGGYQAGLFIVSAPSGESPIGVSGRLGAAILIELPPEGRELRREIQVISHDLVAEFPDELSLDALFSPTGRTETRVRNVGETFVRAVAVDSYRSWLTSESTEQRAPGTSILRATDGPFATSQDGLPWIGPASVTTEIVYERGAQDYATIVVQAETFIVPWRLLVLLLAIVAAAVGFFLWRYRRSLRLGRTTTATPGTAP